MVNVSIKSGDTCLVIAGKDKGKQGKVLAVNPEKGRVLVEGVNIVSRHTKPRSAQDHGGIIKREAGISISNVMVVCPTCGKPTRVGHKVVDGKSVRVCKCGSVLDKKFVKETKKAAKAEAKAETKKVEAKAEEKKPAAKKAEAKPATKATAAKKAVATKTNKTAAKPAVRKTQKDV